nr:hypothetical protein [Bacillaceae bacterium]
MGRGTGIGIFTEIPAKSQIRKDRAKFRPSCWEIFRSIRDFCSSKNSIYYQKIQYIKNNPFYGKDFYDIDIVKTNTATLKRIPGVDTILFHFIIKTQTYEMGTNFPILIPATAGEPNVTAEPVVKDGV